MSLGAVVATCDSLVQAAPSALRRRYEKDALIKVKARGKLSAALAGRLAGRQGFLNTLLYGRIGRVGVRQLHHRHHRKHGPSDDLTVELNAALSHLVALADWASPRTVLVERSPQPPVVVIGDAFFDLGASGLVCPRTKRKLQLHGGLYGGTRVDGRPWGRRHDCGRRSG